MLNTIKILFIYSFNVLIPFLLIRNNLHAQLVIQTGAIFKTTGNAVVTLRDMDLINNGTLTQHAGDGKFVFTGTANNSVSGSSNPVFDILEVAKTGPSKVSLSQDINIASNIIFTSGLLDLNNNNLYLQPAAILTNENESSHITGTTGGYIEITNTMNAPAAINPGNLGAIFTSTQNFGSTIIRRGNISQTGGSSGNSIFRYYDILPTNNSGLNATLRLNYFDAELNGITENALVLWKSPDNSHWTNMGFTNRDVTLNYVEKTGLNDFSRWTLSSANNALPVLFTSLNMQCSNSTVTISWVTAGEQNSSRFEIQRSNNGTSWQTIGIVPAAGFSSTTKNYFYTDNAALAGADLYRIAEFDINGSQMLSPVKKLHCIVENNSLNAYPNPVNNILQLQVHAVQNGSTVLQIHSADGKLLLSKPVTLIKGSNQFSWRIDQLAAGNYFISSENHLFETITIVKQ